MNKIRLLCFCFAASSLLIGAKARAQTYADLFDLSQSTGSAPQSPNLLAQGQDGNLYSTMPSSWPGNGTTVMSPCTAGGLVKTHEFMGPDFVSPYSGLTLGMDGNFFGTTYLHTTAGFGEVFEVSPAGAVTNLYSFNGVSDGGSCWAPPIQASDGNLYGVTQGTTPVAYRITLPSNTFTVLQNLPGKSEAPLIEASDGNFYGTTIKGGAYNFGTVFQLTRAGVLTVIYSFKTMNDGTTPDGGVIQGFDGNLYGTTYWGGTGSQGTVYKLTLAGVETILHNFNGTDGAHPPAGLVQGSNGFLYGVTGAGGASGHGAFFKIDTQGMNYAVLHHFDGKTSGGTPLSTPFLHTNGTLFGWASTGPNEGCLYSINDGLKPFISVVDRTSAVQGTVVAILGQGFGTATGIKFGNGAGTILKAFSDTFMLAIPTGNSTTGKVTVLEPGGSLSTLKDFRVIPTVPIRIPVRPPIVFP